LFNTKVSLAGMKAMTYPALSRLSLPNLMVQGITWMRVFQNKGLEKITWWGDSYFCSSPT